MHKTKTLLFCFLFATTSMFSETNSKIPDLNVEELLDDYFDYKQQHDSIFFNSQDCLHENGCFDDSNLEEEFEEHPAHGVYKNIWTRERLNPYQTPIKDLPDSIKINCSDFVIPVPGYITSHFGVRKNRFHYGTDIKLNTGDSVRVAFSGKVRIIDYEQRGFGKYVVVRHKNGLETVYAHLSKVSVAHNEELNAGDVIGLGGRTGRATGPHLHFEIRYLGNAMNPNTIIDFEKAAVQKEEYVITKNETFYHQKALNNLKAAKYVTVRKGDTLGAIASRSGTSVTRLCKLNNIQAKKVIRPGQKIRVR